METTVSKEGQAPKALRPSAIKSALALIGGNSLSAVLGVVGGLLVARFISPETAGTFRAYSIPLMYLSLLHLGTFDGVARQVPFLSGKGTTDLLNETVSAGAAWNIWVSRATSSGFLMAAIWQLTKGDALGALGWASQAAISWRIFYGGYLASTYRTLTNFVALARVQTYQSVLALALVFTLPSLGFAGLCLRAALPPASALFLLHRYRPFLSAPVLSLKPLTNLIRVGLPLCFWGTIYTSIWTALESSLMLTMGGVRGLGLFAVANIIKEGIGILPQAIAQVLAPRIGEAYGRGYTLGKANRGSFTILLPLMLAMVLLAALGAVALDQVVPRLVPAYSDGLPLMKLSLWMGTVHALGLPLSALFAAGKAWSLGRGILAGLVVFPLAALVLAPHTGNLVAVSLGSILGHLVRVLSGYWELYRHKGATAN